MQICLRLSFAACEGLSVDRPSTGDAAAAASTGWGPVPCLRLTTVGISMCYRGHYSYCCIMRLRI